MNPESHNHAVSMEPLHEVPYADPGSSNPFVDAKVPYADPGSSNPFVDAEVPYADPGSSNPFVDATVPVAVSPVALEPDSESEVKTVGLTRFLQVEE